VVLTKQLIVYLSQFIDARTGMSVLYNLRNYVFV